MKTNNPSPNLEAAAIDDHVIAAVRSHRVKIRVLTSVAFLFGFLAIAASVLFVCFYLVFYLPKQKQLLHDAEVAAQQARNDSSAGEASLQDAVKRIDKFLGAQIALTHVVSMGTTIVAMVVGMLGLGTLLLLTVVILNRRATLNQINASLARVSDQLRHLQEPTGTGPSAA
jgi:heme exporter protein D